MENKENTVISEQKKTVSPARIVICLTVICLFVAGLLGVVDHFTRPQIAANEDAEKQAAIKSIFGDGIEAKKVSAEDAENELYIILKDGMAFGYCAEVKPSGFGGEIKMMVGVDHLGEVRGVNIVTMSETPGLGARANEEAWFLEQFKGKSGSLEVGSGVDAISGATITSKAVTKGVNDALALSVDLAEEAKKLGTTVWSENGAPEPETEAPEAEPPETEAVTGENADLRVEDTITYVDGIDGDYISPTAEYPANNVDVHTDTVAYITETNEPPKDWQGNYIFPEDETTEEETDTEEADA